MSDHEVLSLAHELIRKHSPEVITLRRMIHQNPEISFEEYHTSDLVFNILKDIAGITVSRPTSTSVYAVLKGHRPGKTVAVRSDLDALELQEEADIPYKSLNPGVMHACGHDGHTAILVGVVKVLAALRAELQGEVHFIFQHAEEKHPGGAKDLVKAGLLQPVDMIISAHLWAALETGKIGLTAGPLMAAPDNFKIVIKGQGGHAAMPHEAIDPIVVSAHVIISLQTMLTRQVNATVPAVLSIASIQGGSAYNIIPETVELTGTVRTFDQGLRQNMPEMMEHIIKGVCSTFGADYTLTYGWGYAPVINDEKMVEAIYRRLAPVIGRERIEKPHPVMVGEDFSEYLKEVPGVMIFIGAGNKEMGIVYPHHHPCFNIDERALAIGMETLVLSVLGLLDQNLSG